MMNHHPHPSFRIAIIESNSLARFGLESILEQIVPQEMICCFAEFSQFQKAGVDNFAHYFVSSQIYFEHSAFFISYSSRTIVLAGGVQSSQLTGVRTLDVSLSEKELMLAIRQLHNRGHHSPSGDDSRPKHPTPQHQSLSGREIEVLVLITRGFINKEIADRLNISITTVITHRKNIMEKLGVRSVSALTVYAVMRGYVDPDMI